MSSLIALAVVLGVFYRFGLDFGLKIYFLIFRTTEKETFMKHKSLLSSMTCLGDFVVVGLFWFGFGVVLYFSPVEFEE